MDDCCWSDCAVVVGVDASVAVWVVGGGVLFGVEGEEGTGKGGDVVGCGV